MVGSTNEGGCRCWAIASPDEAIVISGCCRNGNPNYIRGGRVCLNPCCQIQQSLNLQLMTVTIHSKNVYTKDGVPVSVEANAQVKIDAPDPSEDGAKLALRAAAENFIGRPQHEIQTIAKDTLEGHQRAIMSTMTPEQLIRDQKLFGLKVLDEATKDMKNMGFKILSYTIRTVDDNKQYLKSIAVPATEENACKAAMGKSGQERDQKLKSVIAKEKQSEARFSDKKEIARANRDYKCREQQQLMTTRTRELEAKLEYQLQEYKEQQTIVGLRMDQKLAEKNKKIELLEQETLRVERVLQSTIKEPALAYKYEQMQYAEAEQAAILLAAEAEAEEIRLQGEAEAYATRVKGQAEAERMRKAAEAYQKFDKNAMVDLYLKQLPRLAAEVSAPLQEMDKITMVSTGSGELGAQRLISEVTGMVETIVKSVADSTGVNLSGTIKTMTVESAE